MRKSIIASALAGVMLLAGCSGGGQESANSVAMESSLINSSEDSIDNTSPPYATSTQSIPNTSNPDYDIVTAANGISWLYDRDNMFYTNGKEAFKGQKDDTIVECCYADAIFFQSAKEYADKHLLYLYWLDTEKQEPLATCIITRLAGDVRFNFAWSGDWERIGNSEAAKKCQDVIDNFDFSSTDGNFELDGYKVNITGDYEFSTVDNQFSEWNGKPVVKLEATVENVSAKYKYCMLFCTITAPSGERVNDLDSFFDDALFNKEIGKGKIRKGYFTFPYSGDGEYKLEFSDIVTEKFTYKVDVKRNGSHNAESEKPTEQSKPADQTSVSKNTSDILEDYKKDVFVAKASPLSLDTGNEWYYTENTGGLTAVAYVDKYGNLDDNTIVSNAYKDLLDVIIKKPHKGSYYYYWAKENGDVVGVAFSVTAGGEVIRMPITWGGDYSHLNDNEANKQLFEAFSSTYGTSE